MEGARQRKAKETGEPERKDPPASNANQKKKKGSSLFTVLFFLLLILAAAFGYLYLVQKFQLPEFRKVKKAGSGLSDDVKAEMLEKRQPRLFNHAVPAGTFLSHNSFQTNFSYITLTNAQRSSGGIFAPFDPQSPLVDATYLATTGSVDDLITLEAGDFWKDPQSAQGVYHYYEAQTYRNFREHAEELPKGFPVEKQGSLSPRVVFATKGSRTKPHSHNSNTYLAVLDGSVDVVLFPPSETHHLYPYPEYHPNFGSGQALYQENYPLADRLEILLRYPDLLKAKGLKANASAGDIIYIPPFWYAQVSFNEPSVLLKTFSSLYETEVLQELMKLDVPHTDNLDSEIFIVKKLIDWIIPSSVGIPPAQFIRNLVSSRYVPLYKDLTVQTSTDFSSCQKEDPETEKEVKEFSEKHLENIKKLAAALEGLKQVRLVVMEQYVEHLVQKTISAEDAYNFYLHCYPLGLENSRSTAQDIE